MIGPNRIVAAVMSMLAAASCATPIASPVTPAARLESPSSIEEQNFVPIGGIEQWVTISGKDRRNPPVLFLHGGPGNPLSPYSRSLYGTWTDRFTIVQWDQRGAGRTFGRNPQTANTPLTLDLMVRDGIQVAEYLRQHLDTGKIALVGGSWGSALGMHMVRLRPDLFHLYVGVGQLVEEGENQTASLRQLGALAEAASDRATIEAIERLGPPPWANPRNFGILRRLTRQYEARATDPAPASWWVPDPAYATPAYEAEYEAGEEYSYLQFVGPNGSGLLDAIDLRRLGSRFEVPIYLVQGQEDLVTAPLVARAWFDSIAAPRKEFVLVERTGHDPNPALLASVRAILERHLREGSGSR